MSAADASIVKPNGIKTLLANSLIKLFINSKSTVIKDPRNLQGNPPDCNIYVFSNFIIADELFAKALRMLKTCLLVNNNLCRN